jgi:hypothetical protein
MTGPQPADQYEGPVSPARLRDETRQTRFHAALARHDAQQAADRLARLWSTGETPS